MVIEFKHPEILTESMPSPDISTGIVIDHKNYQFGEQGGPRYAAYSLATCGFFGRGFVSELKVLIVGGGIGGLTSAIALGQRGFHVEIAEKDPDWSVYGREPATVDEARQRFQLH